MIIRVFAYLKTMLSINLKLKHLYGNLLQIYAYFIKFGIALQLMTWHYHLVKLFSSLKVKHFVIFPLKILWI